MHCRKCVWKLTRTPRRTERSLKSRLTVSRDLGRMFAERNGNDYNATRIVFHVFRNEAFLELGDCISDCISENSLEDKWRVNAGGVHFCGFANCNFAMRKSAGKRVAANRRCERCAKSKIPSPTRCISKDFHGTSSAPRELLAEAISHIIGDTSLLYFFPSLILFSSHLRKKFPLFRAHLAITGLPQADSHSTSWMDAVLEKFHRGVRSKRREVMYHKYTVMMATSPQINVNQRIALLHNKK